MLLIFAVPHLRFASKRFVLAVELDTFKKRFHLGIIKGTNNIRGWRCANWTFIFLLQTLIDARLAKEVFLALSAKMRVPRRQHQVATDHAGHKV